MDVEFERDDLRKLYTEAIGVQNYKESAYKGFLVVMTLILNAGTIKDLQLFRKKNFEELKGKRSGHYSLRLDQQYRLVFKFNPEKTSIVVLSIEDYH